MKKLLLLASISILFAFQSFAAQYATFGAAFGTDSITERNGTSVATTQINSFALNVEAFMGESFGLYSAVSLGLPTGIKVSVGTLSVNVDPNAYSTKLSANFLFGLGSMQKLGTVDLTLAAGLGVSEELLSPVDYTKSSVAIMTAGPGLSLGLGVPLAEGVALTASCRATYGMFALIGGSQYFQKNIHIVPAAGVRIKTR